MLISPQENSQPVRLESLSWEASRRRRGGKDKNSELEGSIPIKERLRSEGFLIKERDSEHKATQLRRDSEHKASPLGRGSEHKASPLGRGSEHWPRTVLDLPVTQEERPGSGE